MITKEIIIKYLDNNIIIKDGRFYDKYSNNDMFGTSICDGICLIFGVDKEDVINYLMDWSTDKGMSEKRFDIIYKSQRVDIELTHELFIGNTGITNGSNGEMMDFFINKIYNKIEEPMLLNFGPYISKMSELVVVMSCIGYDVIYDDEKPYFKIIDMTNAKTYREVSDIWRLMELRIRATSG